MSNNCPTNVNIIQVTDKCKGNKIFTDCVIHEDPIIYLDLPADSNMTDIIDSTIQSLADARSRIEDLEESDDPSSAVFTPTDGTYTEYDRSYWIRNGNILQVYLNGTFNGGGVTTNVGHTISLPNGFLIDDFSITRTIGIAPVNTGVGGDPVGNITIKEKTDSEIELVFDVPTNNDDYYFSVNASVLIQ